MDWIARSLDRAKTIGKSEYEIMNLGGSETTSLKDLIHGIASSLDIEPTIKQLPMQPGDVKQTYADISKAQDLIAYCPDTHIEDGLQKFADWGHAYYEDRPVLDV